MRYIYDVIGDHGGIRDTENKKFACFGKMTNVNPELMEESIKQLNKDPVFGEALRWMTDQEELDDQTLFHNAKSFLEQSFKAVVLTVMLTASLLKVCWAPNKCGDFIGWVKVGTVRYAIVQQGDAQSIVPEEDLEFVKNSKEKS